MKYLLYISLAALLFSCTNRDEHPEEDPSIAPPRSGIGAPVNVPFTLIAQHPHDTGAYTQGLQYYNGKMYEGTGDYENSSLRITDYKTGKVEKMHKMGTDKIFGEGINIFGDKLYQLTWQNNLVYVYDLNKLDKPIRTIPWPYEGWGITNNGKELIISDGSANLYFVDPASFKINSTVAVLDDQGPVQNINELEYIKGYIYANVYGENYILKIEPSSGHVVGKMDLPGLLQANEYIQGHTDVLNGIAYDSTSNTMFITGKRWPKLFELKLN
jgi:glutaminyl-peptide cyclotransferase